MKDKLFPVGNPTFDVDFHTEYQGVWEVVVAPCSPTLPLVPYRDKSGVKWLGDCHETVVTHLITEEVVYARQHGYQVEVVQGYYFTRSEPVFHDFMVKCEKLECRGGVYKELAKLMRNSLYGKFASRPWTRRLIVCDKEEGQTKGYANYMTVRGDIVDPQLFVVHEEVDAEYIMPHWGTYITAYQRMAMYDIVFLVNPVHNLGIDTDSIKLEEHIFKLHAAALPLTERWGNIPVVDFHYGAGKIENEFDLYRSHGPKNYVFIRKGTYGIKLKGIPKKAISQEKMHMHLYRDGLVEPLPARFDSIVRTASMMKSGGTSPFTVARHRAINALHSEKWLLDAEGHFYPAPPSY